MIAAPQGFRRTLVLERSLPGRSSRDPGLTNCLRNRGKSWDVAREWKRFKSRGPNLWWEITDWLWRTVGARRRL